MKIESGIPIPERNGPRTEKSRAIAGMKCGQSVLCMSEEEANSVRYLMRHHKFKALRRKVTGGWRVWRVS